MININSFQDAYKALLDLENRVSSLAKNASAGLVASLRGLWTSGYFGVGAPPTNAISIRADAQDFANVAGTTLSIEDTDLQQATAPSRILRIFTRKKTTSILNNLSTLDGTNWNLDQEADPGIAIALGGAGFSISFATAGANPRAISSTQFFVTTTTIGFFNGTPAVQQILNAYTANIQGSPYSGLASGLGGSPYAQVSDVNALRLAYENLRASYDDLRTKLRTSTLVG